MHKTESKLSIQKFAQKAIVVNAKHQILLIKYGIAKYQNNKISGKYGLPGGKLEFSESPDESLIKEVKEETGITCQPGLCINTWNWEYQKDEMRVQINAVSRICKYVSGELAKQRKDLESNIEKSEWVDIDMASSLDIVFDEKPSIETFIQHVDFYLSL